MSGAQHTPGPWDQYADDPLVIVNSEGSSLGEAHAGDPFISAAEQLANARLFAGAPELLDALQHVLHHHSRRIGAIGESLVRAAIAKATGSGA